MNHYSTLFAISFLLLLSCSQRQSDEFNVTQLPKEWVHLTKTDSGMVVFNSCNAGNFLITFKNNSEILFHGQQEDYQFEIVKSQKTEKDTIRILTNWKGTTDKQSFNFHWVDKQNGLIRLASSNPDPIGVDFIFVDKRFQSDFPVYDQPCVECWPEEECD